MNIQFSSDPGNNPAPAVDVQLSQEPQIPAQPAAAPDQPAATDPPVTVPVVPQAGGEPVAQPDNTPKILDVPEDKFFQALVEFTGGSVKTKDDWAAVQASAAKAKELEATVTSLEGWKGSLNPMALHVNEMISSGKTIADVSAFIKLQATDFGAMADIDVIRAKYAVDYPMLSAEEVDALLEGKGFISLTETPSPAATASMKIEAKQAREFLESTKIPITKPAPSPAEQAAAAERQALHAKWDTVKAPSAMNYSISDDTGYNAAVQLSKEAIDYGFMVAKEWAKVNGVDPDDPNVHNVVMQQAASFDLNRLISFAVKDASAKAELRVRQELAGAPPKPVEGGQPPAQRASSGIPTQFSS